MKRVLLSSIATVVLIAAPASAADMPVKAHKQIAAYDWSGVFIGGHIGGLWSKKDWNQTFESFGGALDRASTNPNGLMAGGAVGYNWQSGPWVFGIEGEASWTNAKGCGPFALDPTFQACTNMNWVGTVTGRVGRAFDRLLIYGKGGLAVADEDHYALNPAGQVPTNNPHQTRQGWIVGVGTEWALTNNWSVKIEYNHMDFGTKNFEYVTPAIALVERFDVRQQVDTVKFGVNYRFKL